MAAITFDTHKFVKELEAAGVPEVQAEAFVKAQQEILAQVLDTSLATRSDIERVERKLIEHDGDFKLVKWMLGISVASTLSLVFKIFF